MNTTRETVTDKALNIAVVGSGAAGLTAAHLLQREHRVTLIEKNHRLGGHTNTVQIHDGPDAGTMIDTGFIVYNELNFIFSDYQWQYALELANSKLSKLF